ncbi:MAG: hypothetical protein HY781_09480, partial [Chloroflexi bacterium]|nr:hypothetical protein [Chloroflexota bacterium]
MKKSLLILVLLALMIAACNLPGSGGTETQESPDAVDTHAAETMNAELTRVASQASPTLDIPANTFTPTPSNTPIYTVTKTPI